VTRVTAVIPAYRASDFLERAVRSVQAQTVPVARIAVVDDWSPDDTLAVARRLAVADPRVMALQTPKNGGPGPARQVGVDAADTEFVAYLDADDEWHPEHIARALAILDARPDVVCTWGSYEQSHVGSDWETFGPAEIKETVDSWSLIRESYVVQSGAVARRAAVLAIGGNYPDVRWCEDYCLWTRLSTQGVIANVTGATVRRHDHEAQISRQFAKMSTGRWEAVQRFEQWAPTHFAGWNADTFRRAAVDALDLDIGHARANRSSEWLDAVLAGAARIDACADRAAYWVAWRQRHWPVQRTLLHVYDRLPEPMLSLLRRLRPA
jgi:glycosyltransferase involved in cell wall biosynthesis